MNNTPSVTSPAARQYLFRDVRHGALRTKDARSVTITAATFADAERHLQTRYANPEHFTYCGTLPLPSVIVTDREGNSHTVLAAKRLDSFRVLVVREWQTGTMPFVVHTFNEQDGGFHHGHYCETLERAMEVFNAKPA